MRTKDVNKFRFITSMIVFSFVLVFGIVFLTFAFKLSQQTIPENYVKTEATVTKIDEELMPWVDPNKSEFDISDYEFHVFVEYSYNGQTYSDIEYGNYDSSMEEGDKVILYLNPDSPSEFISDPSGSTIFVIIGFVVILVGIGGIAYNIYNKKKEGKE